MKKTILLLSILSVSNLMALDDIIGEVERIEREFAQGYQDENLFNAWQEYAKSLAVITTTIRAGGIGGTRSVYQQARYDIAQAKRSVLIGDGVNLMEDGREECKKSLVAFQLVMGKVPPIGAEPTIEQDLKEAVAASTKLVEAVSGFFGPESTETTKATKNIYALFAEILNENTKFIEENYSEEE